MSGIVTGLAYSDDIPYHWYSSCIHIVPLSLSILMMFLRPCLHLDSVLHIFPVSQYPLMVSQCLHIAMALTMWYSNGLIIFFRDIDSLYCWSRLYLEEFVIAFAFPMSLLVVVCWLPCGFSALGAYDDEFVFGHGDSSIMATLPYSTVLMV